MQYSEPSVVISTLAEGLPESAPQMVRAVAVDATHVSVTWLPGAFPRGPVLSYVLYLNELPTSTSNHTAYSAVKVHTQDGERMKDWSHSFFLYEHGVGDEKRPILHPLLFLQTQSDEIKFCFC
jgi:hypothetical protein